MYTFRGSHLAFIGLTGTSLAIVAYVLFGPSDKPKSSKKRKLFIFELICNFIEILIYKCNQ